MTHFDIFNGDGDGLCALHQLRLAAPKEAVLVSGVKRDIAGELPIHGHLTATIDPSPDDFMRYEPVFERINACRNDDLEMARLERPELALPGATVYTLPNEPWSRRVRGSFANDLANRYPALAHAVLSYNAQRGYTVSVRTPLVQKSGADELCRKFPTGGGRATAAGINHLPTDLLPAFVRELDKAFGDLSFRGASRKQASPLANFSANDSAAPPRPRSAFDATSGSSRATLRARGRARPHRRRR